MSSSKNRNQWSLIMPGFSCFLLGNVVHLLICISKSHAYIKVPFMCMMYVCGPEGDSGCPWLSSVSHYGGRPFSPESIPHLRVLWLQAVCHAHLAFMGIQTVGTQCLYNKHLTHCSIFLVPEFFLLLLLLLWQGLTFLAGLKLIVSIRLASASWVLSVSMCLYVPHTYVPDTHRGQRVLDSPELELEEVVCYLFSRQASLSSFDCPRACSVDQYSLELYRDYLPLPPKTWN